MEVAPDFRRKLIEAGLIITTGVDGVYGFSQEFEAVINAINTLLTRAALDDRAQIMRFPPALSRVQFEHSGYMKVFPHLAGTVHSFSGGSLEHRRLLDQLQNGDDWTAGQCATDLVLAPAACYSVYPVISDRGPIPTSGRLVDVESYCFRHEPSSEPARMQLFRMREYVCIGSPEQVLEFRHRWMSRGRDIVAALRMPFTLNVATDPFFGVNARIMRESQQEQELKFELSIPINSSTANGSACISFNYHREHFGHLWKLVLADRSISHSGCVAFGLERLALALFRHHGLDAASWPEAVRRALRLG